MFRYMLNVLFTIHNTMTAESNAGNPKMSSEELMKQAKAAINENDETRADDIQFLRENVQKEAELNIPTTDEFLLRFLRAEFFNRDKALQLIFKYYKFRLKYEDEYKNFYPSGMKLVLQHGSSFMAWSEANPQHGLILLIRAAGWKPEICTFDEMITGFHMSVEIAIREEAVQIGGITCVIDFENFGLGYIRHLDIGTIMRMISIIQEVFPARFNGFHYIRNTRAVSILYSLAKPFLSESLKSRLFFHGSDLEALFNYVPSEILPKEFGGSQPSVDSAAHVESALLLDDYFKESNKYGYKKTE